MKKVRADDTARPEFSTAGLADAVNGAEFNLNGAETAVTRAEFSLTRLADAVNGAEFNLNGAETAVNGREISLNSGEID